MVYEWDDKADTAEQQTENKAVLNIKNGNFDITNIQLCLHRLSRLI